MPRLLGALTVVCAVVAATVFGTSLTAGDERRAAVVVDDDAVHATVRAVQQKSRALETATARAARRRSRTAHAGLSDRQAERVVRRHFSDELTAQQGDVSRILGRRGGVRRYLSDFTAVPRRGHGVITSTQPLRVGARDGSKAPVDLRLRPRRGRYAPVRATSGSRIARRLSGGFSLEGGTRVRFVSGKDVNPRGRVIDGRQVLFPNAAQDTDVIAMPRAVGFEFFTVARSARSPERQVLHVNVPNGGRLVQAKDGGLRVVSATGRPVATISRPVAEDAQGRPVQASMRAADADSIVLTVRHHGRDVAYPVLVDPVVQPWQAGNGDGWWYSGNSSGLERWTTAQSDANGNYWAVRNTCYSPVSCYGSGPYGLYIYAFAGYNYAAGAMAQWNYALPADRTSYFKRATFLNTFFNKRGDTLNSPFVAAGIYSSVSGGWTGLRTYGAGFSNQTIDAPANQGDVQNGKSAVFALFNGANRVNPTWQDAYAGGVVFEVDDPEAPSITGIAGSGSPDQKGWVRDQVSVVGKASDPGLGVMQFNLGVPGLQPGGGSTGFANGCTGRVESPCPKTDERTMTWDSKVMPNGINELGLWVYDAGLRLGGGNKWPLKVDNEAPQIQLTGSLAGSRGADVMAFADQGLRVDATDGTSSAPRSGVKRIDIRIDGEPSILDQTCPATQDSCSLSYTVYRHTAHLAAGRHTVAIDVEDRAGNHKTDSWDFFVYRTSWQHGGDNHAIDTADEARAAADVIAATEGAPRQELMNGLKPTDWSIVTHYLDKTPPYLGPLEYERWTNDRFKRIAFRSTDYGEGTGIQNLTIDAPAIPNWDGKRASHMLTLPCGYGSVHCVGGADVATVPGNQFRDGSNSVEVVSTDAAGNVTRKDFHIGIDQTKPRFELTGSLAGSRGADVMRFPDQGLRVDATDGSADSPQAGVAKIQITIDGEASTLPQTCGETEDSCSLAYVVYRHTANLANGLHTVNVEVTDRAGNVATDSWNFYVHRTSWEHGGDNHQVDTRDEAKALDDVWQAATPAERENLDRGLKPADWTYFSTFQDKTPPLVVEAQRNGYWARDPNTPLGFHATDYGRGSGIQRLYIRAQGHPNWSGNADSNNLISPCGSYGEPHCGNDAVVGSRIGDLPSGLQTVEVTAIDAAGNTTTQQYHVPVDKTEPRVTVAGGARSSTGTAMTNGDLDVAADDDHSGVVSIQWHEVLPDGSRRILPGTNRTDAQCPGYGCSPTSMRHTTGFDPLAYGWQTGTHTLEVDVWDRAGNLYRDAWQVDFYETSWRYGGSDRTINTQEEHDALGAVMIDASEEGFDELMAGLTPIDRAGRRDSTAICTEVFAGDADGAAQICHHDEEGEDGATAAYALNSYEKRVCRAYAWYCPGWYIDSRDAVAMAERLFTGKTRKSDGTRTNAFQHAFWNALMIKRTGLKANAMKGARAMATAHEAYAYDSSTDIIRWNSRMDMVNNQIGRNVAETELREDQSHSKRHLCHILFEDAWYQGEKIPWNADPYEAYRNGLGHVLFRRERTSDGISPEYTGLSCEGV
ncbi:hypothetical protein [Conexibacter sp. SYSU D00693]|uniref:DUF6973 domain-containing protein n=1 Tax=Conexibacter sp. SYSU D00693 TaxID=2812560 RepID=UPI00196B64B0|nr:hypothetical protein [Conexibacter sp. SYSU D00693]